MEFLSQERSALLIDGSDLNIVCGVLGYEIDFRKLLDLFRARTRLIRANYYALYSDSEDAEEMRPLVDWLSYNGYVTHTRLRNDGERRPRERRCDSMSVEITVDALQLLPNLDHLILVSGSPELRSLVAAIQKNGRRVSVVASRKADEWSVADQLRRQCDQFIDLADLAGLIALESRPSDEPALTSRSEPEQHRETPH